MEELRDGVPVSRYCLAARTTREKAIRKIVVGEIAGWQDKNGRWFVHTRELERAEQSVAASV